MSYQHSFSNSKLDKVMTTEQFEQIVEAIVSGKYSWACLLILRFAGYNPLHYIPYRTYNRLMKENCQIGRSSQNQTASISTDNQAATKSDRRSANNALSEITDLAYLEAIEESANQLSGGNSGGFLDEISQEDSLQNFKFVPIQNYCLKELFSK